MTRSKVRAIGIALASVTLALVVTSGGRAQEKPKLKVTHVGTTGPTAFRVDLVIVGDGYTKEDFAPKGAWETDTNRLIKNFFEKEPYAELKSLFNIHLIEVPSTDRGVDQSDESHTKHSAFGDRYGVAGIKRLLAPRDENAVRDAVSNVPDVDMILILVNDSQYGGSGGKLYQKVPMSVCSTDATAFLTAIHELGHSFADLGDEYIDESVADRYPMPANGGDLPYPNLQLATFVDTTSRDTLIKTLKWGQFLAVPDSERAVGKGWYEGGYYRAKGIYRPAEGCIMYTESGGGRFCYVCLDVMRRAIFKAAGRSVRGAYAGPDVTPPKGALARCYELYLEGKYSTVLKEVKALKSKKLTEDDARDAQALLKAMEEGLTGGLERVDGFVKANDIPAAKELLALMDEAYKGTEGSKKVSAKRKQVK